METVTHQDEASVKASVETEEETEEEIEEEIEDETEDEALQAAVLAQFNKACAKINFDDLTFKNASNKEFDSLEEALQGAIQAGYNMAIKHASQIVKKKEETKPMPAIKKRKRSPKEVHDDDHEDDVQDEDGQFSGGVGGRGKGGRASKKKQTAISNSKNEDKTDTSTSIRTNSGNKISWLREGFGCYRVELTKRELRSLRPDFRFINKSFKEKDEDKNGSSYLTIEETEALTVLRDGEWVISGPRGKFALQFAVLNLAASYKLTIKNEAIIAKGLEAERISALAGSGGGAKGKSKGKRAKVNDKEANVEQPPAKKSKTKHSEGGNEGGSLIET